MNHFFHALSFMLIYSLVGILAFCLLRAFFEDLTPHSQSDQPGISPLANNSVAVKNPGGFIREDASEDPSLIPGESKEFLETEEEWLMDCQLPSGAIAQTPDKTLVVPYFGSLAAKTLAELDPERARMYITWYLNNIESPDRWGLEGTIYDYRVMNGLLKPTMNYDSADSYAATFLSAVCSYYEKTQDRDFIVSNLESINKVARVITTLQDKDGLVFAKPRSSTKYLMDNAENYKGLNDWASVLDALGDADMASQYRTAAQKIQSAILNILYDPARGFAWSYSKLGRRFPVKGRWYPDGVSQIYLIFNDVVSPEDPVAVAIWDDFNAQFPGWEVGVKKDQFPWGTIALAAYKMNDTGRASRFLAWVRAEFQDKSRPYPWYVLESSSLIELETSLTRDGFKDTASPSIAGK